MLSIIIPCLNESGVITQALLALAPLRARGCEVILVDGGSEDDTLRLARPHVDLCLQSTPGRARQMNAGAAAARREILCFLHADTQLPSGADGLITLALTKNPRGWGRFDVRIDSRHPVLACVAHLMNGRSRWSGIATGDQALFVTRYLFEAAGRYPDIALMEDIALCERLRAFGPPVCIRQPVLTSGRRWEKHGVWRTILLMWWLRLAYWMGVHPDTLARRYVRQKS